MAICAIRHGSAWHTSGFNTASSVAHGYYLLDTDVGPRTSLTLHSGNYTPENGEVVEGLDITGDVLGYTTFSTDPDGAISFTLRDCRVRGSVSQSYYAPHDPTNYVYEYCAFTPATPQDGAVTSQGGYGYTMRRCEVTDWKRGPVADGGVLLEESWFHDFWGETGDHRGVIGSSQGGHDNVTVRRCRVFGGPLGEPGFSGMLLWYDGSPEDPQQVIDCRCEDTYFEGSNGFVMYIDGRTAGASLPSTSGVEIVGNVFGRAYFSTCAEDGLAGSWPSTAHPGLTWVNNRWDSPSGELVSPPGPVEVGDLTLTAIGEDHQVSLSWNAFPGADSYRIERADPSDIDPGFQVIASGITATTYIDDEQSFEYSNLNSSYTLGTLVLGMLYEYRVIPVDGGIDQTAIGPDSARPDDGYTHPNWTSVNGSTKRDARNCGHWMHDDGNMTVLTGTQQLDPGTYSDTKYTGQVRLNSQGTYVFNRCWIFSLFNEAGEPNVSTITLNDSTIGQPRGLGGTNSAYDQNGLFGGNGGKITMVRSMAFHGGSQVFLHISGPNSITDSFFVDMTGLTDAVDPHVDCVWNQSGGTTTTIARNLLESATRGQSSIIGPGAMTGWTVEDNVLNGLSASGALCTIAGSTYTDNGFKRWETGNIPQGFNSEADGNPINNTLGGSTSGSFWCDDGSAV